MKKKVILSIIWTFGLSSFSFLSALSADSYLVIADEQEMSCPQETMTLLTEQIELLLGTSSDQSLMIAIAKNTPQNRPLKKLDPTIPRSYNHFVTDEEKAEISYIINTLSNTSYGKLLLLKGELETAGKQIDHLHPLRHLGAIFTDEQLKVGIRNMRKKTMVWKSYVNGLTQTLGQEAQRGNVTETQLQDFAHTVAIDPAVVLKTFQDQRWKEFIEQLVDVVPRHGDARRYDM